MRRSSENGWALLAALVSLALATALLLPWQDAVRAELRAAQRALERCQCRWALDAALQGAQLALDADSTPSFDGPEDSWTRVLGEPVIVGGVEVSGMLRAADRLWDANNAAERTDPPARSPAECWRDLCALSSYPEGRLTAAALGDWTDPDGEGAAENSVYLARDPAYTSKNAPLDAVPELLLVRGFDARWLTGATDRETGIAFPPLTDTVTVLPRARPAGLTPVNLNLAPRDLVRAVVGLDRLRVADRIVRRRDAAPFRSLAELEAVVGPDAWPRLQPCAAVRSSWFRLDATAVSGGSRVIMCAELFRPAGERTVCRRFRWCG